MTAVKFLPAMTSLAVTYGGSSFFELLLIHFVVLIFRFSHTATVFGLNTGVSTQVCHFKGSA